MMKPAMKLVLTLGLIGALSLGTPTQVVYAVTQLPTDEQTAKVSKQEETNESEKATGVEGDRTTKLKHQQIKALKQIGEYGKNIYNSVKIQNWKLAQENLTPLQAKVQRLKSEMVVSPTKLAQLDSFVTMLESTITAKSYQAMCDANRVAMLATNLATKLQPQMPIEVAMLDYYGRELEIWSAVGNTTQLKEIAGKIRQTWDALESSLQTRGGSVQLHEFDDALVALVETADSPTEYHLLAEPLLSEVSNLQEIFHS